MTDHNQPANYDQRQAINQKISELDMSITALTQRVFNAETDIREIKLHRDYNSQDMAEMKRSIEAQTVTLAKVVQTISTSRGMLKGILWLLSAIGGTLMLAVAIYALK